jgi:hypothetical protein
MTGCDVAYHGFHVNAASRHFKAEAKVSAYARRVGFSDKKTAMLSVLTRETRCSPPPYQATNMPWGSEIRR